MKLMSYITHMKLQRLILMINLFSIFDEIENELMQSLENGIEEIEKNLQ